MKVKLLFGATLLLAALSLVSIVAASAADVPAPYTGLKNPFAWTDTAAQQAGQKLYQQSCIGCHGATGGNVPTAKFNDSNFPKNLEASADFYFWTLSEGRLTSGMPPFKGSFSTEQRWQMLTYMWTLAGSAAAKPPATGGPPAGGTAPQGTYTLKLATTGHAVAGEPLNLTVTVKDSQSQPVSKAEVKFLQQVDFFAKGTIEIGEATTDDTGVAQISYAPRSTGEVTFLAGYGSSEGTLTVSVAEPKEPLYETEIGVKFIAAGPQIFLGPSIDSQAAKNAAPVKVFRLPGGLFSMLWIPILVIALIWFTYFRVMYQVFRIPPKPSEYSTAETNTRLLPTIGLVIVVLVGLLLLSMFAIGPYSQWHVTSP